MVPENSEKSLGKIYVEKVDKLYTRITNTKGRNLKRHLNEIYEISEKIDNLSFSGVNGEELDRFYRLFNKINENKELYENIKDIKGIESFAGKSQEEFIIKILSGEISEESRYKTWTRTWMKYPHFKSDFDKQEMDFICEILEHKKGFWIKILDYRRNQKNEVKRGYFPRKSLSPEICNYLSKEHINSYYFDLLKIWSSIYKGVPDAEKKETHKVFENMLERRVKEEETQREKDRQNKIKDDKEARKSGWITGGKNEDDCFHDWKSIKGSVHRKCKECGAKRRYRLV